MLRTLKDLFDSVLAPSPAADPEHSIQLATAVLLVEVMRAEPQLGAAERAAVVQALQRTFTLGSDEIERLLELAHEASRGASDFHQFTSVVNARFDTDQKVRIVECMWRVAYADGHLDVHESHLISRVAELMHVTHGQYIAAKLHARDPAPPAAS